MLSREGTIEKLRGTIRDGDRSMLDVLVVGGGIVGSGVARDAHPGGQSDDRAWRDG